VLHDYLEGRDGDLRTSVRAADGWHPGAGNDTCADRDDQRGVGIIAEVAALKPCRAPPPLLAKPR
jgi:hypothetical protein